MNVLEKILEEIKKEAVKMSTQKSPHHYYKAVSTIKIEEIIRYHMDEVTNCGKCSRRKWYQKGFEDGKKDNDWIPVEEKLPEEYERYKGRKVIDVLVTTAKGKVTKVQRQSHNGYWWWGRIYGEPTAWQPLLESYIKNPK